MRARPAVFVCIVKRFTICDLSNRSRSQFTGKAGGDIHDRRPTLVGRVLSEDARRGVSCPRLNAYQQRRETRESQSNRCSHDGDLEFRKPLPRLSFFGRATPELVQHRRCDPALDLLASTTVTAVMLTMRRTVADGVRMWAGAAQPSKMGPTATL